MRTNGFALFRGGDRRERIEKILPGVQRFCKKVVVGIDWDGEAGSETIVGFALDEERGLPVIHGIRDGGEYASLEEKDGILSAFRDRLGTRPLYTDRNENCIASDHRFIQGEPRLLPNGTELRLDSMKLTTSELVSGQAHGTMDECARELAKILSEAVIRRVRGKRKVAVSFSGGLDSSLIAFIAAQETEVVLCSAYAAGSRDQTNVKSAADSLALELIGVEIDRETAAREVRSLDLPFETTPMDRALWCIYSTTSREAAGQGAELIMLGQLADELFGGYMKYARAAKDDEGLAAKMMRADVLASGERAFIRDEEACARFCEVRFPFADERVAAFGLGVPVEYKISGGERKVVLREAATLLGLPEILASAPKKAAQYSSGLAKLVP